MTLDKVSLSVPKRRSKQLRMPIDIDNAEPVVIRRIRERLPLEDEEGATLMQIVQAHEHRWPELVAFVHFPISGYRFQQTALKLRKAGAKAGYEDYLLDCPRGPFAGLRIELKRQQGGRVDPLQAAWHEYHRATGYMVAVCRGADDAWRIIRGYLHLPMANGVSAQAVRTRATLLRQQLNEEREKESRRLRRTKIPGGING